MLTDCYGNSLSTASTALLWCNVVANIYDLVIIAFTDKKEIEALLGPYSDFKQLVIMIQTVVSICAIMISNVRKTSCLIFSIKFWGLGLTFVLLSVDILLVCTTAIELLTEDKYLNEFWTIKTHSKEPVAAPDNLYSIVAVVLAVYFVFKFYVAYMILLIGKKLRDDLFNDEYFLDQDVERNTPSEQLISSELPPSYDECVTETDPSTPPPAYNVVQKF